MRCSNICIIHLIQSGPLLLEYVEADVAVRVYIGVEAGGGEPDGGRLVGVARGELEPQLVHLPLVHRVLGALDRPDPREQVIPVWEGGYTLGD